MEDLVQLVDVIAALEEWTSTKKLSENAADGPDVNYEFVSTLKIHDNPGSSEVDALALV